MNIPTQNLFLEIVVADIDAEKHVDDSLNEILELKFCQNIKADVWPSF